MKVLVIGSGGREHALAWKIAQSPKVRQVLVAPGNAGTALEPGIDNVAVSAEDLDGLLDLARTERADLTVVGPEVPLVAGIVDRFDEAGLRCFGPRSASARLEGSKAFAKDFLQRHGIPTAASHTFTDAASALDWLDGSELPVVIKADGLAAGKGVVIAHDREQATDAIRAMLERKAFGEAGQRILIEEFLHGEEASFIAMVDGEHILPLATSQDHKARDDGDTGPNTGGMGAYSPAPVVTDEVSKRIMREVMEPAVAGMAADGAPYTGFLYAGLMISPDGTPKVLEFNCRFGDPETQPIMMRLQTDLVELIDATLDGQLGNCSADWDPRVALGVVMAAGGYPDQYRKGYPIEGLPEDDSADVKVFHAGTRLENGQVLTNGGRVLCVVALADTVSAAQQRAYETVRQIHWPNVYYRTDIGYRAVAREHR